MSLKATESGISQRALLVLLLSLGFFWFKGIQYVLLGSWVPFLIVATFTGLLLFGSIRSAVTARITFRLWAILLILWGSARGLLTLVHYLVKPIPEGHVVGQLTGVGIALTILVLLAGILLWKWRK